MCKASRQHVLDCKDRVTSSLILNGNLLNTLFFNLPDHAAIGYLMQHIYVYNRFDLISFHVHGSLENVSIQIINVAFAVLCLE